MSGATPASRALVALDGALSDPSPPCGSLWELLLDTGPTPFLALARAAVARVRAWELYHALASSTDSKAHRERAAYEAWEERDAALDDATVALIAALAEPPA